MERPKFCWNILALFINVVVSQDLDSCEFNVNLKNSDVFSRVNHPQWFWFKTGSKIEKIIWEIDLPEFGAQEWIDVVVASNFTQRRFSYFGDVSGYLKNNNVGDVVSFTFIQDTGNVTNFNVTVKLFSFDKFAKMCQSGVARYALWDGEQPIRQSRLKRDVRLPKWVSLDENDSADVVFVWPILSLYGVQGIALAAGTEVGKHHEYLQISDYERSVYALSIPGVHFSGPTYDHEISVGSHFVQGRQLLKYSKRDAAWLFWDFKQKRPCWNGNHGSDDYWVYRASAVPKEHAGLIFDHTES